jgi:hypothetical protein
MKLPPRGSDIFETVMKNPHAVALGRLGGAKGGPARAKALSARRRHEIAKRAGVARARSLSAAERQAVARRAAAARWSPKVRIAAASEAPPFIRRLLKSYDPAKLRWTKLDHRYVIVRAILLQGDGRSVGWLRGLLYPREIRALVRRYRGAGCSEADRQKLRGALRLTLDDIPPGASLGVRWRAPRADQTTLQ